jgi:alpha-glucosidase
MKQLLTILLLTGVFSATAQYSLTIQPLPGEYWWGGAVGIGERMPFVQPLSSYNLESQNSNNQVVPLLLSNKGRYLWSDKPFSFSVGESGIQINSRFKGLKLQQSGNTLREAYLDACAKYFPPTGVLPDSLFFTLPQYNTWIELMYNQNQEDILNYARGIIENGLPPGVLMIDDNWQKYYGNFEFKPEKFPDPHAMMAELKEMGFKVMLWVCPFVSPDSPEFRELHSKGYLIRRKSGGAAILGWWNGHSACYDMTNPAAREHFIAELKHLQTNFGIDGFKFDAGDNSFYTGSDLLSYKEDAISVDHTEAWARIGLEFPFNEYRACWKMGGEALVQRLGDKDYSWWAVQQLIPQMTVAGLMGYAYTCPDMIGGGQFRSFINLSADKFDQSLIVRSAQVHALMPMMQYSVAPWRILSEENMEIIRSASNLHVKFSPYIMELAKQAAVTGEPIIRSMEYVFPGEGFATNNDQFMLGDQFLVAPMVTPGLKRAVRLPRGRWRDDRGVTHRGGRTVQLEVPLNRLPWFERVDRPSLLGRFLN